MTKSRGIGRGKTSKGRKEGNPRGRNGMTKQQEYDLDHGITDENRPVCQICGKPVGFTTQTMSYNQTCSRKCANTLITKRRHARCLHGQEKYDLEHGITDENRPVCQICGKPVKFLTYYKGYTRTCGSAECQKLSKSPQFLGTVQQRYDIKHNITDENRPKCKVCGKPAGFLSKKRGYGDCCSMDCWKILSGAKAKQDWTSLTFQQRYDIKHNITDENRPKCKVCGKQTRFLHCKDWEAYIDTCCKSCSDKLKSSKIYEQRQLEFDAVHGYTIDTRPKCPICGKPTKFICSKSFAKYTATCGSRNCAAAITAAKAHERAVEHQRQYDIEHNIIVRPTCPICGKPALYYNAKYGYAIHCGNKECANKCKDKNYFKHGLFNNLQYCIAGEHWYRSSYEYSVVLQLEQLQIQYEIETLKIYYYDATAKVKKHRHYKPDLIIHYKDIIIIAEVKSIYKLHDKAVQFKAQLAHDFVNANSNYDAYIFLTEDIAWSNDINDLLNILESTYMQVKSQQLLKLLSSLSQQNSLTCQK